MKTEIDLSSDAATVVNPAQVAELLLLLKSRWNDDWQEVGQDLPAWLTSSLSPVRTREEAEEWLAKWRAAPDPDAFERETGWTVKSWLHWFSFKNDLWSIGDAHVSDDGLRLTIVLDHDDSPFPYEALRWLAWVAGLKVGREVRVS
ncbi:hypothetical protein [Actinoplanes sichuanensis]|uniref:Uncharacterized protein n=1 Tax=Actinoplanes sichuanensis TaxID=512349 RepID=A0ABW4A664_9ACTN|nr:hypothetical protein [Actinoplanes sichuanensis]